MATECVLVHGTLDQWVLVDSDDPERALLHICIQGAYLGQPEGAQFVVTYAPGDQSKHDTLEQAVAAGDAWLARQRARG
jgi:hypothetical protein